MAEEWRHHMASSLTPQHKTMWAYPTETGKTRNNQTDPNPNRQLLLGLNNPPHGGVPPIWPRPFLARSAAFLLQSLHNAWPTAEKGTPRKIQPTHTEANKENSTHAPPPPFKNIETDNPNKEHAAVSNEY